MAQDQHFLRIMTSFLATCKSGNDWKEADLSNYDFFSPLSLTTLPLLPHTIEPYATTPNYTQAPDDSTSKWLHYLDLAQDKPEEIAGGTFADRLLHLLKYDRGRRLTLTRHAIPSTFCRVQYNLTADLCLCDGDEIILLLARNNQDPQGTDEIPVGSSLGDFRGTEDAASRITEETEPILIASAVSAFQRNNYMREKLGLSRVGETFPGIAFVQTFPVFYRIKVTKKLSQAIETGTVVDTVTDVYRYIPNIPGPKVEGMKNVGNRHTLL